MKRRVRVRLAGCLVAAAVILPCGPARAADDVCVTWSPYIHWRGGQIDFGPTGATGYIDGHHLHVVRVAERSPADGVLAAGDVIVGANGTPFVEGEDARMAFGNAVGASETTAAGGKLRLLIERGGRRQTVVVPLRVMGAYGRNWPFDCAKSRRILADACAYLAGRQHPDGYLVGEVGTATYWAGLLFLASGDVKYLDNARRAAYYVADQNFATGKHGLNCWPRGYAGIFLAEYYLATGDATVYPQIKAIAGVLAKYQMACGSWGHNGPHNGYGAVNEVGLACFNALILARECGVRVDERAIRRADLFFRKFAGKGWIPYGDHKPWRGNNGAGKDSQAVVAFSLLNEPEIVRMMSTNVASSYRYREECHTGSFFAIMWGPVAALHAGDEAFREFMDYQKWFYDISRTWNGGIRSLPNAENLSGRTPGTYAWSGARFTTGGLGLAYALPLKKMRILGGPRGALDRKPGAKMTRAQTLVVEKKWKQLDALLAADEGKNAGIRRIVETQKKSVAMTLDTFDRLIDEGDVYRASELLKGLGRLLGPDAPELAGARETMAANQQWVPSGERYYKAWAELLEVTEEYWHYYGRRASHELAGRIPVMPQPWDTLVPMSAKAPQTWKVAHWDGADATWAKLDGWPAATYDDAKWTAAKGAISDRGAKGDGDKPRHILARRTFTVGDVTYDAARLRLDLAARDCTLEVYFNGTKVARIVRRPHKPDPPIMLTRAAARLIKPGKNVFALHCILKTPASRLGRGLDISLQAGGKRPK